MAKITSNSEKADAVSVQLALQICQHSGDAVVGESPTDEELAALYDTRLDEVRRAQVLSYIASNTEIYQRWIHCVEALAYMEENEAEVSSAVGAHSVEANSVDDEAGNHIRSALDWLSGLLSTKHVLSGGLSTAAVLVLVLYLLPFQSDIDVKMRIDDAYSGWGGTLANEWTASTAARKSDRKSERKYSTNRSFFSTPKDKSMFQKVLETGFKTSILQVGELPYEEYGIDISSLSTVTRSEVSDDQIRPQYDVIQQIGQLSALAVIQCEIDPNSDRINNLVPVLIQLREYLKKTPQIVDAVELVSIMDSDDSSMVCQTAGYVVGIIVE